MLHRRSRVEFQRHSVGPWSPRDRDYWGEHLKSRAVRMAASHVVTLEIDRPKRFRLLFHGASNAARTAMRASDAESHAAPVRVIAVRALTAPRSIRDGRTSRFTPSRGRDGADSENRISSPAGVL